MPNRMFSAKQSPDQPRIGHTPLLEIPDISKIYGLPNLLIKDESANPTGTWKDRRTETILSHLDKTSGHRRHVCLVTAGNAALSIAQISKGTGLLITAVVNHDLNPNIKTALEEAGVRVIPTDLTNLLDSDSIKKLARTNSHDEPIDISTGTHTAYADIIDEIVRAGVIPDYIIAPYGTGEAVFGMAERAYHSQLFSPDTPVTMFSVKPERPDSLADKLSGTIIPYREWLHPFRPEGYQGLEVTEAEIARAFQEISPHIPIEPSSATAFAIIRNLNLNPDDKVVVINSGRGIY